MHGPHLDIMKEQRVLRFAGSDVIFVEYQRGYILVHCDDVALKSTSSFSAI